MLPRPLNILVLEDEAVIALELRRSLTQSGHRVIGPFAQIEAGEHALLTTQVDFALLDIQLGRDKVFALAEQVGRLGIPFAFLSGYETDVVPAGMRNRPFMTKPFKSGELLQRIATLTS